MAVVTRRAHTALTALSLLLASSAALSAPVQQPEYAVGPQDVLTITVWEQADLSGKYTVGADGNISYPLLGNVRVAGLTSRAIEALLTARLADGYLKKPQVTVEVTQFLSQRIFIMGEVGTPGPLPLTGEMTLLEALARSGGVTEYAGGELVLLRSAKGADSPGGPLVAGAKDVTELARVSIRDLRAGRFSQNVPLQDGDTIFVPRAEMVYVLGQVNNPGSYTMEPGMTVLRAISLAGGATQIGSTKRVKIVRIVGGRKTEIKAKLDDVVKPGDSVMVGTRLF